MPPIRRSRGNRSPTVSTRIPIQSLSGGVGRQAPSKRTPFEAENLDNCFVTVERSVEKRNGFEILKKTGNDFDFTLPLVPTNTTDNIFYYWLNIDKNNRFIISIDYSARLATAILFRVWRLLENEWEDLTPINQWDANDPQLTWSASIPETDVRNVIVDIAKNTYATTTPTEAQYNAVKSTGVVNINSRKYITFGSELNDTLEKVYTAKEALRIVSIGTNTLVLNTLVKAGFSSNEEGLLFNLNGNLTTTLDLKGRKITYYTSGRVIKTSYGRLFPEGTSIESPEVIDSTFTAKYIPVEDYVYGELDRPWLGQSMADFSEIRFPPNKDDWYSTNWDTVSGTVRDNSAQEMLKLLYDYEHPHLGGNYPVNGRGKIYYCAGPYLSQSAGYYRIIGFPETETYDPVTESPTNTPGITGKGRPYTQRVRTPDAFSYLDPNRMPQNIIFNAAAGWSIAPIEWTPRTTGNRYTNPGPSVFLDDDKKTARPTRINAISTFRDRLFFAAGDVVFSSQLGDYQNLWINDPTSITSADPIDIRASLNQYAEIVSLTPFDEFLFINTKGNVQFELRGSQNVISPLTAEISPTTFYATAPLTDPILIGSQIYFFDSKRLYIYYSQKVRGLNTAIEVSSTCPNYLPTIFNSICTAVAQDTIFAVDGNAKNNIYCYTNRYSGDRVLQSAFFRFVLETNEQVESIQSYDNYLYVVSTLNNKTRLFRLHLLPEKENIPRLDYLFAYTIDTTTVNKNGLTNLLDLKYQIPSQNVYCVLGDDFENLSGSVFKCSSIQTEQGTTVSFSGINLENENGKTLYIGGSFVMNIELSEQFLRDEGNNIVDGVLNLRTLVTRHNNTGSYKVEVTRRNRPNTLISEFNANRLDAASLTIEKDGEFVSKIFAFSDAVKVNITSDLPAACNIVQIEFKGKFKQTYTSLR